MRTAIIITRKGKSVVAKPFDNVSEARLEFKGMKSGGDFDSAELWDSSNGRTRRIKTGASGVNPAAADRKFYDKPEVKEVPTKKATKKAAKSQSKSE